jgi:hypothetical protein
VLALVRAAHRPPRRLCFAVARGGAFGATLRRSQLERREAIPFRLGRARPGIAWAITALDKLRELDLQPGDPARPILVPLVSEALPLIEAFGVEMQNSS